jgi:hypothetical protein
MGTLARGQGVLIHAEIGSQRDQLALTFHIARRWKKEWFYHNPNPGSQITKEMARWKVIGPITSAPCHRSFQRMKYCKPAGVLFQLAAYLNILSEI